MPRGKTKHQRMSAERMEAQIQAIKHKMDDIVVPKLQKQVVKFSYVIPVEKNAIIGPSTQYVIGADAPYRYRTTSTTPQEVDNPLSTLLDAYYEMYSNVTYKHVEMSFEPFVFDFALGGTTSTETANQIVCHLPTVTCLDINATMPLTLSGVDDYSKYSVRGGKSFRVVPAKKAFVMKYPDVDRVLFQKYGKFLWQTNGTYADREKWLDGPGIQFGGFYPGTDTMANQFGIGKWGLLRISQTLEFSNRVVLSPVDHQRLSVVLMQHGHKPPPLKQVALNNDQPEEPDDGRPQPQGALSLDQIQDIIKAHSKQSVTKC